MPYSPTPPSDRAHLVRQPDGFTLTVPPHFTLQTGWTIALLGGLALFLSAIAVWPTGRWFVAGMTIDTSASVGLWGLFHRCATGLAAAALLYQAMRLYRQCRTWTFLEVRSRRLTYTVPVVRGTKTVSLQLSTFAGVAVKRGKDGDGSRSVRLQPRDRRQNEEALFGLTDEVYNLADLEFVVAALRDVIDGKGPEGGPSAAPPSALERLRAKNRPAQRHE